MKNNFDGIIFDIDGILADWTSAWNEMYPEILVQPSSWYLDRKAGKRFKQMKEDGTLNDFYLNNVKPLMQPEDLPFEPHCYITSRPVPVEITEEWLDKYHFPAKPVYSLNVCESKIDMAKNSGVEIFIDDSFDNFVELNKAGITTYLYSAPWNQKHDVGHLRLKSLKDLPLLK